MKAKLMAAACVLAIAGCAVNSGAVKIGPDTYMLSRQAATGFMGLAKIKAKAFQEAGAFCQSQGRVMEVVNTSESQPPYVLGNYPRADIQFMCLRPDDPELGRPKLHYRDHG